MKKLLGLPLLKISMAVIFLVTFTGQASAAPQSSEVDVPTYVGSTSPQQQQGEVILTLSATTANPGEPLTVTVTNLSSSTIATLDHKSLCSIFLIRNEDTSEEALECGLAERTEVVAIPPGGSASLTFNGGPHFLDPGALDPGVYRVEFLYKSVEKIEDIVNLDIPWQTAFSPSFTIFSPIPLVPPTPPASSASTIQGPFVSESVTPFVFTGDLRELPKSSLSAPNHQTQQSAFSSPIVDFDGIPNPAGSGIVPPDTNGAVGPNHYIQTVNVQFAIYDKLGNLLVGPSTINALWAGFGGDCENNNDGDPDVKYDRLADRWVLSQFVAFTHQCIAISRTPDPVAGGWWLYDFVNPPGVVNDYPHFGVWPDAYYMGSNGGYPCCGSDAWAFDRANMLNGNPATFVQFHDAGAFMLPSDLDGITPPPAGTPNVFARLVDGAQFGGVDRLELRQFHVDFAVPANSTFTALPDLPTAAFDRNICGFGLGGLCIPQPGTTELLESSTAWLMYRLQYRNFGTYETLVVNHTVDVDGTDHAGVSWYELRRTAGAWSIFQQGTYAPDADHRWMGSVAMDKNGNMALGYSVSSNTVFPSIRYAGRLVSDPLGTMPQGEFVLIAGSGSQTTFWDRWGDYSAMTVDPVDDCTFWYTTEYYQVTSAASWRTHISAFRFPSCENVDLSITKLDSPDPVTAGGNLTYTLTVTNNGPGDATGVKVTDTLPAGVTFVPATSSPVCTEIVGVVTCDLGNLVNGTSATVTINVTVDPATPAGTITNTAGVAGQENDPNMADNTATTDTAVTPPASVCTILDDFNRTDGPLGSNWAGRTRGYRITSDQVAVRRGRPIYWQPEVYGPDQEACVTLTRINPKSRQHALLLKVQELNNWRKGAILVSYNARLGKIDVKARDVANHKWILVGSFTPATPVMDGDQLRAKAFADGTVEVFINDTSIGTADAGSFYANKGGQIGLWFRGRQTDDEDDSDHDRSLQASDHDDGGDDDGPSGHPALFDDFGGGTIIVP